MRKDLITGGGMCFAYPQEQGAMPCDQMGVPWTREEWVAFRDEIDAWYATNPDDQIAQAKQRFYDQYIDPDRRQKSSHPSPAKPKAGHIYLIRGEGTPWHKIGRARKPVSRLATIGAKSPFPCTVLRTIAVADTISAEKALHAIFADKRVEGEWFTLNDADVKWLMTTDATTAELMVADAFCAEVVGHE